MNVHIYLQNPVLSVAALKNSKKSFDLSASLWK